MIGFINDQRAVYGVESICRVLPIAPSTYYHRLACLADPSKASARHQRDKGAAPRDQAGLGRELPSLRGPQGMASAQARGL